MDDQKDMIDGSDYLIPPTKLPESITGGKKEIEILHNNSFSNLPKGISDYIEREELEVELEQILEDRERFPVITLKGRGGIGKTSLAIHVINKIAKGNRFEVIVWFSARDVDLFVDGPKQVQATVLNQKDISKEYFNLIYSENPCPKNPVEAFSSELSRNSIGPALYVFDNFETITYPLEVFEWLNTFIRLPNKILITSRLNRDFKADYPIEVKGMNDKQCRELISAVARKHNIEALITETYISKLIEESDGHPYIIKIIMGEVAKTKRPMDVKRIVADKDKILEALFKRTFATLSSAAKRVFLTLCSWNSVNPQLALEAVILQEENERIDIDAALEELNKSSFIELLDVKGVTFINVPLAAILYGSLELEVYPEKLQINRDKKLLMEFGAGNLRGIASGLAMHINKKFNAVGSRVKSMSDLEKELPTLEYIASKYPQAWIYIANLYKEYDNRDKEKEACREFLKVAINPNEKKECWQRLADICRITNDWVGESSALSELITLPNITYTTISNAAFRVNKYYMEHPSAIGKDLKTILMENIAKTMENRIIEADATDCSRLAWLYLNLNDEIKALKYTKHGLDLDPSNQHCIRLFSKLSS